MSKYLSSGVLFLILLLAFSSCRIGRKPTRKKVVIEHKTTSLTLDSTAVVPNVDTSSQNMSEGPRLVTQLSPEKQQLVQNLQPVSSRRIQFATFSGKAKMHYEGKGNKQDFTANIRMKKDSVVWVSVTALGGIVQVARVLITPDSIRMVNYLQKEVTLMPMCDAARLLPFPVDFATLQNMIIGNALMNGGEPTDATDFGGTWSITHQDSSFLQQITFSKTDSTMRTCQLKSLSADGPACMIQYGNYEQINNQRFPDSRALNIEYNGNQYYLDMNYNNASFDGQVEFPFSVPRKYTLKDPKNQ